MSSSINNFIVVCSLITFLIVANAKTNFFYDYDENVDDTEEDDDDDGVVVNNIHSSPTINSDNDQGLHYNGLNQESSPQRRLLVRRAVAFYPVDSEMHNFEYDNGQSGYVVPIRKTNNYGHLLRPRRMSRKRNNYYRDDYKAVLATAPASLNDLRRLGTSHFENIVAVKESGEYELSNEKHESLKMNKVKRIYPQQAYSSRPFRVAADAPLVDSSFLEYSPTDDYAETVISMSPITYVHHKLLPTSSQPESRSIPAVTVDLQDYYTNTKDNDNDDEDNDENLEKEPSIEHRKLKGSLDSATFSQRRLDSDNKQNVVKHFNLPHGTTSFKKNSFEKFDLATAVPVLPQPIRIEID